MEWTDLIYVWTDLSLCQDQMFLLFIVTCAGGAWARRAACLHPFCLKELTSMLFVL